MLINDLVALLMQVPPMLAGSWGAWFAVGLMLSIWQRKERARLIVHGPTPKHKSGVRPPSGVRAPKQARSTVAPSSGDAFGELEALLEPTAAGTHRRPGDANPSPMLAAPQSLP
jgi:hypothetical protein